MNAYIYRAALHCEECAMQIRHTLRYQPRENPLTSEGYDYVRRACKDALGDFARKHWAPFYGIDGRLTQ